MFLFSPFAQTQTQHHFTPECTHPVTLGDRDSPMASPAEALATTRLTRGELQDTRVTGADNPVSNHYHVPSFSLFNSCAPTTSVSVRHKHRSDPQELCKQAVRALCEPWPV